MNPTDLFLFLLSLQVAAASLVTEGWTFNGIGPAVIASAGGFWQYGCSGSGTEAGCVIENLVLRREPNILHWLLRSAGF